MRRGELWGNPSFLKFWAGEAVSRVGTPISTLALPLVAILTLDASPGEVGLLAGLATVPYLLVTPLAGVWVDRYPLRPALAGANFGRALLLALVPLLASASLLALGQLYAVALLAGCLTALFEVAWLSYLPALVGREHLVEANSKLAVTNSVADTAGPGLGGMLVQVLTAPGALLVDAATYLFAGLTVVSIHQPESPKPARPLTVRAVGREVAEGLRATLGSATLRPLCLVSAWFNCFEQMLMVVFLLYAARVLALAPGQIGVLTALPGVGVMAGAAVARRVGARLGFGRAMASGMAVACAGPALIPLAGGTGGGDLVLLAAGFLSYGAGLTLFNVHAVALRQSVVAEQLLGRVNASYRLVTFGAIPVGALAAGGVAGLLGPRAALAVAAVALAAGGAAFALTPVARRRELPAQVRHG